MKCLILTIILFFSAPCIATKSITACGHHDYPPWNWKKDNKLIGVCVEVAKELFKKIGYEVDFGLAEPWARCQNNVRSGKTDVNICAFKNTERLSYSQLIETPMGFNENAVFVKKSKRIPFEKWKDLNQKRIGLVTGVSIGKDFDTFLKKNTKITRVSSVIQLYKMLKLERIDAFVIGRQTGRILAKKYGFPEIIDLKEPVLTGILYISMSKKSKNLILLPKIEMQLKDKSYHIWVESLIKKYSRIYLQNDKEKPKSHEISLR